eukprot:1428724-Rhodomonas_salina.2
MQLCPLLRGQHHDPRESDVRNRGKRARSFFWLHDSNSYHVRSGGRILFAHLIRRHSRHCEDVVPV